MNTELPLAGLKVLDFTWVMAGPAATRYLADYGATVVKIESATKIETGRTLGPAWQGNPDPETSAFMADNNAGKLGMTLNIRTETGQALARRLVQWADVVAEAFTPKVMRSCGLDFAALQRINPGIIMLSTSLNGLTGPYSQVAGYGTLGAALAGFAPFVEWPDRPPAGPFSAYTDYVAPKFAVAALMAALEHRRLTGEGQHIDMAQSEASIHFLGEAVLEYTANGRVWPPAGNSDRLLCPNGAYPAAGSGGPSSEADRHGRAGDHLQSQASQTTPGGPWSEAQGRASQTTNDRWVALSVGAEQQWQALARLAGPPLADDPRFATVESRRQHEAELDGAIAAWTATQRP
ncbi:MAG TPA: CoA transferase, partial [Dehalococcoidia bacterium]|nr:CoA transferase [Dehalococcoidia bacterium]